MVTRSGSTSGVANGESTASPSGMIALAWSACIAAARAAWANCSWSPPLVAVAGNAVSRYCSWSASGGRPRRERHPVSGGSMLRKLGLGLMR